VDCLLEGTVRLLLVTVFFHLLVEIRDFLSSHDADTVSRFNAFLAVCSGCTHLLNACLSLALLRVSGDLLEALVMGFGAHPQHFVLGVSTLHFSFGVVLRSTTDLSGHGVFSTRLHHAIELLEYFSKSLRIVFGDSFLGQVLRGFSSYVSTLLLDSLGTDLVRDWAIFFLLRYFGREFGRCLHSVSFYLGALGGHCFVVIRWKLLSLNFSATNALRLLKVSGAFAQLAPRARSILGAKLLVDSTEPYCLGENRTSRYPIVRVVLVSPDNAAMCKVNSLRTLR